MGCLEADRMKLETSPRAGRGNEEVEVQREPDHGDLGRRRGPVGEVCRKHGISSATYYQWKSKYAWMSVPELKRVKELEAENARLKRLYADLALENAAIKDVLSRKF